MSIEYATIRCPSRCVRVDARTTIEERLRAIRTTGTFHDGLGAPQLRGREGVRHAVAGHVDGNDLKAHAGPVVHEVRMAMDSVGTPLELEPVRDWGRSRLDVLVRRVGVVIIVAFIRYASNGVCRGPDA